MLKLSLVGIKFLPPSNPSLLKPVIKNLLLFFFINYNSDVCTGWIAKILEIIIYKLYSYSYGKATSKDSCGRSYHKFLDDACLTASTLFFLFPDMLNNDGFETSRISISSYDKSNIFF